MVNIQDALNSYKVERTFIGTLIDSGMSCMDSEETLNRLCVGKIIDYVRTFCKKVKYNSLGHNLEKLHYVSVTIQKCAEHGFLTNKSKKELQPILIAALNDIEEGYLTPEETAEVLKRDVLESRYLAQYDVQKCY